MSKRNPTSDLNHENWDQEDEREDPGRFRAAAEDVLKKRDIRVAKRRAVGAEDKGTGGLFKSFTGFTGFGTGTATPAAPISFGFVGTGSATVTCLTAGGLDGAAPAAAPVTASSGQTSLSAPDPNAAHLAQLKSLNESVLRWIQSHLSASPYCVLTPVFKDYERHLADIERKHPYIQPSEEEVGAASAPVSVTTSAAATNASAPAAASTASMPPAFSFSSAASKSAPVTTDSKSTAPKATIATSAAPTTTAASTVSTVMPPTFNFKFSASAAAVTTSTTSVTTAASEASTTTKPPFVFGGGGGSSAGSSLPSAAAPAAAAASTAPKTTAAFFFGSSSAAAPSTTSAPLSGFSFGAAPAITAPSLFPPGSFLTAAGPSGGSAAAAEDHEEEEYEPPKPETREIREDGEVFNRRCKLFYLAPDTKEWKERGVGCAHLKPAGEAAPGKAQLIIRADNTLGTILLNILVTKEMTLSVTKNNLSLACLPNPPLPRATKEEPERRPVPFLVRLKTESDAKELLEKINQLRGA